MSKPLLYISVTEDGFIDAHTVGETKEESARAKGLYLKVEPLLPGWEKDLKETHKTKAVKEKRK